MWEQQNSFTFSMPSTSANEVLLRQLINSATVILDLLEGTSALCRNRHGRELPTPADINHLRHTQTTSTTLNHSKSHLIVGAENS